MEEGVATHVGVLHLRSYEHMGIVEFRCVAGCDCQPLNIDGLHEGKFSQVYHTAWPVTRAGWDAGAVQGARHGRQRLASTFCCRIRRVAWQLNWPASLCLQASQPACLPACLPSVLPSTSATPPRGLLHICSPAEKCVIEARTLEDTRSGEHKVRIDGVIVSEVAGEHELKDDRIHVDFNAPDGVGQFEW